MFRFGENELLKDAVLELVTNPKNPVEDERAALILLAENALLNPELTGKSAYEILQVYSRACIKIEEAQSNPPPMKATGTQKKN